MLCIIVVAPLHIRLASDGRVEHVGNTDAVLSLHDAEESILSPFGAPRVPNVRQIVIIPTIVSVPLDDPALSGFTITITDESHDSDRMIVDERSRSVDDTSCVVLEGRGLEGNGDDTGLEHALEIVFTFSRDSLSDVSGLIGRMA